MNILLVESTLALPPNFADIVPLGLFNAIVYLVEGLSIQLYP